VLACERFFLAAFDYHTLKSARPRLHRAADPFEQAASVRTDASPAGPGNVNTVTDIARSPPDAVTRVAACAAQTGPFGSEPSRQKPTMFMVC
jgi:hypothetical protein